MPIKICGRKVPHYQEEKETTEPRKRVKRGRGIKPRQLVPPDLLRKDVAVNQNAPQKHSWGFNEAFPELFVQRAVNLKNQDYRCQILKNIELIKQCFDPRQSNISPAVGQASSTNSTEGKKDENLQTGGIEEAGSGEQRALVKEIDSVLSPEDRASVCQELQIMICDLGSQLESFLPAAEPEREESSRVKGIQIANEDMRLVGPEAKFKWSHFDTALKVIQEMFCRAPSIELADDVDYIVETKIVNGSYDFSQDESVVRFVEKVLHYTRLVRELFSKDIQTHKEQLRNEIEFEIESLKKLLEAEMTKIEERVKFLTKEDTRADTSLSLLKRELEKATKKKKRLECELANQVTKLNQLKSDLECYQREKSNMVTHQNTLKQFVHGTMDEYCKIAQRIEEMLHKRLRNLDRVLVQKEERYWDELERLKMVVLRTSVENPVASSGSRMNPVLVKEE